jgi:Kelch motif/Galactose oxidase, central domain
MSHDDLTTLLTRMAEEVDRMPQREYSARAWAQAGQLRRRRVAVGAAAVVLLIGVPVAVVALRGDDSPVGPAGQVVSQTPLRARAGHTATLLSDGRVLIVGGCATDGCTTAEGSPTTEYFVAGQGFTPGPELIQPRQGHSATLLSDGRVLIVGGWSREGTGPLDSAEVYDPATSRFEPAGSLGVPRGGHVAVALRDGRVLIAGGEDTTSAELFDPERNEFTPAAPMPEPRFAAPAIALADGRVLVVGGRDSADTVLASALLYDPSTDTWQSTGSMSTPRDKHALATLPDGRVLVMGGTVDDRLLFDTTEIYDPATGQFTPGPRMDMGRYKLTATVDADGRIIVVGGTEAAIYDAGRFEPIAGTAGPIRWVASVTSLPDGDVLIVGGYDDRIRLLGDALLVSPG